jgi:hypothetical protein
MPKFIVEVNYSQRRTKEITVYARDENEACEKAETIVANWDDVVDVEAVGADEE